MCPVEFNFSSAAFPASKHSNDFQIKYEGNALPSDASVSPQWERYMAGGVANEPFYCSVSDGVLTLDTVKGPSATRRAPIIFFPASGVSLSTSFIIIRILPIPGIPICRWAIRLKSGSVWTRRFRSRKTRRIPTASLVSGCICWKVFSRTILHHSGLSRKNRQDRSIDEVLYTGDLTDKFHILRIVRHPGGYRGSAGCL